MPKWVTRADVDQGGDGVRSGRLVVAECGHRRDDPLVWLGRRSGEEQTPLSSYLTKKCEVTNDLL